MQTTLTSPTDNVMMNALPQLSAPTMLTAQGLFKTYRKGAVVAPVLQGVDLSVQQGELLSVVGQSGSGKSTLLHLLATLDRPDEGEIYFGEHRIDNLPAWRRDLLRNRYLGMIFQAYHLMPELTALENVLAPALIRHSIWSYMSNRRQLRQRATELLETVGLGHRTTHKPRELSGGEMQRTAIARALMLEPKLLLADEPTGNLDQENGEEVLRLLRQLNADQGLTIVMVTHDLQIAAQSHRTVLLAGGKVQEGSAVAA